MSDQSTDAPTAPATDQGSDFASRDEDRLVRNHVIRAFAHHAGLGPHPGKLHKKKNKHHSGLMPEMPYR